ncbi:MULTISPECIES: type VI secretion system baseplate subunit TssE [Pseudoalteromonas]|jgi:type VI secretion system protein ImpF|uniref:Type VI secretion protein T6SSi_tssE n=1 Tax=Pseudoalteromonas carrageenovora IAM 12662 TaxID=1314868 RepID=A0A2K4XEG2_PSEVC|nr:MULTISPECIES: type VI secretion system baseplate subunit TssE [Pseudoalteromonas]KTF15442.1 lysozyme [Pseudoalteromonas sp. H103]MBE0384338.1 type VI secretion system protein ImpF [Pseudoalteromonas carrageenovora IAM 12662]MDO6465784.1 type VI secretion system baseplate subunit TssE [Pseudoalteromonas carrageenovora]MDO6548648.1 type VI secretion system baseplate subunit TssE [Pseudoalteromonas carrageenovora]MDO6635183.1 type VI secretion system baseplate subunit TssE [Pseudoalteromonas c|tara:strand:+ start:541 stop:1026 length:486 start_codon:yes stop_codon:yes gene_type:complete
MIEHKQQLQASIIDKLIDDEPDFQDAPSRTEGITISELRKNVRRDIEALLNARIQWHTWPTQYTELATSCLSYGLPDFSSMSVSSHEGRALLCETVRKTILKFEPRFLEVEVFTDEEVPLNRVLNLRINALLYADPEPEFISFDSEVEPVNLGMKIIEASL